MALASAQFPDADWLSLDCVQSGHSEAGMGWDMWSPTSSYLPIRQMYNTMKKDGTPRPVIDLEPHYDNTPYGFQVCPGLRILVRVPWANAMDYATEKPTILGRSGHPKRGLSSGQYTTGLSLYTIALEADNLGFDRFSQGHADIHTGCTRSGECGIRPSPSILPHIL